MNFDFEISEVAYRHKIDLRCISTPPFCSVFFSKGILFCDFLFASVEDKTLINGGIVL